MTGWSLILPYPKPPEGLSANWRGHWRPKARSTAEVRDLVVFLARSARITPMQRMEVELVWVVTDRRKRDGAENLTPLLKAVIDGLAADKGTSAHLTPDDNPDYVTRLMPRIKYDPDSTPHFEVHVRDITHRPSTVDELTGRLT